HGEHHPLVYLFAQCWNGREGQKPGPLLEGVLQPQTMWFPWSRQARQLPAAVWQRYAMIARRGKHRAFLHTGTLRRSARRRPLATRHEMRVYRAARPPTPPVAD